jgi:hypothetical protein
MGRLNGHNPLAKVTLGVRFADENRDHIASSSRCRLTSSVTNIGQ